MVEVKKLTKNYGNIKAVDNISFTVGEGEILGFLGPNGAGKSTTMNIITGYISSTSGTVTIDGKEILENPKEAKAKIGYLPEIPPLYTDMTVKKYLEFMFDLKKVKLPKKEHIEEVMRLVRITEQADRIIKNLSKGYRQRVGFAGALIGNPEVIILDEPTVGLDPKQIIEMRGLIKSLAKNHTVLLSSHIMQEISAVCDKVVIISKGRLVAYDTPENLSADTQNRRTLSVTALGTQEKVKSALLPLKAIKNIKFIPCEEKDAVTAEITTAEDKDLRAEVSSALSKSDCAVLSMKTEVLSLEDVFLALTADDESASKSGEETDTEAECTPINPEENTETTTGEKTDEEAEK